MAIGYVKDPVEVPLDQPWSMDFRFWKGRSGGLVLTLASADVILRRVVQSGDVPAAITLTTTDQTVSMQGGVAGPRVDDPIDAGFVEGTWNAAIRATDTEGGSHQVRFVVEFRAGV